jgi:hypothetical protein
LALKNNPQGDFMSWKRFLVYFFAEALVTVVVILLFRNIDERRTAGLYAGTLFLGIGMVLFWDLVRHGQPWRAISFWVVLLHLGFSSIPMVAMRLLHWESGFHEIRIWNIPGPLFHYTAEKIFAGMMLAALVDALIRWVQAKRTSKVAKSTAL